jgi:rhamnose transport system permease protein
VMLLLGGVLLHRSTVGRRLFVIGDNAAVARFSGIDVARSKVLLFTASGFVAGVAGVLFAARLGSVRANIGEGFELDIITMVLLGGVSIFGGSGTLLGVALAIGIVLNLRNGLGLASVESNTQTGVIGALLIVSVLAQNALDRLPLRRAGPEPGPEPGPGSGAATADSEAAA